MPRHPLLTSLAKQWSTSKGEGVEVLHCFASLGGSMGTRYVLPRHPLATLCFTVIDLFQTHHIKQSRLMLHFTHHVANANQDISAAKCHHFRKLLHVFWAIQLMKHPVDETSCWWNIQLMKHHIDETSRWWNIQLIKHPVDETSSWWNILLMKHPVDEISCQCNIQSMKHSVDETSCQWNIQLIKHPVDQTSSWWNIQLMKHPVDETSSWWNIQLMKHPVNETSDQWSISSTFFQRALKCFWANVVAPEKDQKSFLEIIKRKKFLSSVSNFDFLWVNKPGMWQFVRIGFVRIKICLN